MNATIFRNMFQQCTFHFFLTPSRKHFSYLVYITADKFWLMLEKLLSLYETTANFSDFETLRNLIFRNGNILS